MIFFRRDASCWKCHTLWRHLNGRTFKVMTHVLLLSYYAGKKFFRKSLLQEIKLQSSLFKTSLATPLPDSSPQNYSLLNYPPPRQLKFSEKSLTPFARSLHSTYCYKKIHLAPSKWQKYPLENASSSSPIHRSPTNLHQIKHPLLRVQDFPRISILPGRSMFDSRCRVSVGWQNKIKKRKGSPGSWQRPRASTIPRQRLFRSLLLFVRRRVPHGPRPSARFLSVSDNPWEKHRHALV